MIFVLGMTTLAFQGCGARDRVNKMKDDPNRKEDPNNKSVKEGFITELHEAALRGDIEGVSKILDRKVDPNVQASKEMHKGLSPLHLAANEGHMAIVRMLVERGGKVNIKTTTGLTPLHMAVKNNHINVTKFLLDKKADVNVQSLFVNTPLYIAEKKGYQEIIELLKAKNAIAQ